MTPDVLAETTSRLGQIRELERDLAALHGYHRAPHGYGSSLDCIDPATGERLSLGAAISRIRREAREAQRASGRASCEGGQFVARDQVREGEQQAAEQGSAGVHRPSVRNDVAEGQVTP